MHGSPILVPGLAETLMATEPRLRPGLLARRLRRNPRRARPWAGRNQAEVAETGTSRPKKMSQGNWTLFGVKAAHALNSVALQTADRSYSSEAPTKHETHMQANRALSSLLSFDSNPREGEKGRLTHLHGECGPPCTQERTSSWKRSSTLAETRPQHCCRTPRPQSRTRQSR